MQELILDLKTHLEMQQVSQPQSEPHVLLLFCLSAVTLCHVYLFSNARREIWIKRNT